jgi:hypothetical protein
MQKKFFFLAFLMMLACSQRETKNATQTGTDESQPANQNRLTDREAADGWQLLFDGVSTKGWRGFKKDRFPETGWKVQNGTLMVEYSGQGEAGSGGDIITQEQFGDFELKLDWKMSPGGNSGVMFRVTESEKYPDSWNTAPEVQLLDDFGYEKLNDGYVINIKQMTGANYDMHAPSFYYAKPVGEWNHLALKVQGSHVEHWLNSRKIVEYELWSPEWKELVKKSKFAEYADYGLARKGHIALQDHGHTVWFRNIKIRRINGPEPGIISEE